MSDNHEAEVDERSLIREETKDILGGLFQESTEICTLINHFSSSPKKKHTQKHGYFSKLGQ